MKDKLDEHDELIKELKREVGTIKNLLWAIVIGSGLKYGTQALPLVSAMMKGG